MHFETERPHSLFDICLTPTMYGKAIEMPVYRARFNDQFDFKKAISLPSATATDCEVPLHLVPDFFNEYLEDELNWWLFGARSNGATHIWVEWNQRNKATESHIEYYRADSFKRFEWIDGFSVWTDKAGEERTGSDACFRIEIEVGVVSGDPCYSISGNYADCMGNLGVPNIWIETFPGDIVLSPLDFSATDYGRALINAQALRTCKKLFLEATSKEGSEKITA